LVELLQRETVRGYIKVTGTQQQNRPNLVLASVVLAMSTISGCNDGLTIVDRIDFAPDHAGQRIYITKESPWVAEYEIRTNRVRKLTPSLSADEKVTRIVSLPNGGLALTVVSDLKSQIVIFDVEENRVRRLAHSVGDLLLKPADGSKVWIHRNKDYDPRKMLGASPYYGGVEGLLDTDSGQFQEIDDPESKNSLLGTNAISQGAKRLSLDQQGNLFFEIGNKRTSMAEGKRLKHPYLTNDFAFAASDDPPGIVRIQLANPSNSVWVTGASIERVLRQMEALAP